MGFLFLLVIIHIFGCEAYFEVTKNLLERALKENETSFINVKSFNVTPATEKGVNSLSVMSRVYLQYTKNEHMSTSPLNTSMIVKMQIMDDENSRIATASLFLHEITMFNKTLPGMNAVLPEKYRLSPNAFFFQTEQPMIIVLEDLTPLGFKMMQVPGLDLEHSFLAMDVIARFHAASICVHQKEDLIIDYPPTRRSEMFYKQSKDWVKLLLGYIQWNGEISMYYEKVLNMRKTLLPLYLNATKYRGNEFNVLNHGDFHGRNVMFKHNSANMLTDAILVDFQMCQFNSPVRDLIIFMAMSVSNDVYLYHRDKLIERYHSTLNNTMQGISCTKTPISLEELKQQMLDRAVIDMFYTFTQLPYFIYMREKETLSGAARFGNTYRDILVKRLPLYDELGLFYLA